MPDELRAALADLGMIPKSYRHHTRVARSTMPLVLPNIVVRWNEVALAGEPVVAGLDERARETVRSAFASGKIDAGEGLGFVVVHHSTASDYLLVCVWTGIQEMWERLFTRDSQSDDPFCQMSPGIDSPTMCVWEMGPVWNERRLWTRYLYSEHDLEDRLVWATDPWQEEI